MTLTETLPLAIAADTTAEIEKFRQIFAQSPAAILVVRGPDSIIEVANPVCGSLLPGRKVLGHRFIEAFPEVATSGSDALRRVLETGTPFTADECHIPGEGEDRWFNVVYNPLRDHEGRVSGIIAVLTEVTSHVRQRQELERVNRELEEFAYVASHDLQEPLRMVNTYTQLLLRRHVDESNPDAKIYAEFIREGVHRMENLIRDLLSYSRAVRTGDVEPAALGTADLNVSLNQAIAVLDGRVEDARARIEIAELPAVRGDADSLTHVFQNLLSNAIKYRKPDVAPLIDVSAQRKGDKWVVAVRDNGIGFEQKYAERIFGIFKRLHRDQYPGTGIGLAICQRIVERCGGRIWAESEPGVGSTFFVEFPGENG